MRNIMVGLLASVMAVCAAGCATDGSPGVETTSDELEGATPWTLTRDTASDDSSAKLEFAGANLAEIPGAISPRFSLSFFATCRNPFARGVGNVVTFASADACKRFNGSFGGPTSWSGSCTGDVSNCNGRIVCQSHCP